jgi:hypothetical protein
MSTDPNDVTLVIFTCDGREHLLIKTIASFKQACSYQFAKTILVVDGQINRDVADSINADLILHHTSRQGYVTAIANVINLVTTPYFFWLEDDYIFTKEIKLNYMLTAISKDNAWAGISLCKIAPLTALTKQQHIQDDLYVPEFGFAVSPALCRTVYVKDAFTAIAVYEKNEDTTYISFEPFIDEFFIKNNLRYAIIDSGDVAHAEHIGFLESTGREYHMINSMDKKHTSVDKEFISGLGREQTITLYNKVAMLPKLWYAVIVLSFGLFKHRVAYDFAFRIYCSYLKKFKF